MTTPGTHPQPGQVIAGRYRIRARLGEGGMGLVYLAEQLEGGATVALKFLDPEPSNDDSRIARFLREAKVGLQVQHPGATQVLDLGRDEAQRLFVAFEYVEGQDLRELLRLEGRLHVREARSIALQVAQVLDFAHGRSIVHRDVKPENVRVRRGANGTLAKVLDFGIARLLKDAGVRLTAEGTLAGTPRYMAPEQVKDEPFDGRIDQYALGLVLFEMLTGAVAIGGKNVPQILTHQLQTPVPPLAWCDPELAHEGFDAFIARACAKEPRDRFGSMAEFIAALQAVVVDEAAWPAPRGLGAGPAGSHQLTRDLDGKAGTDDGLGDTYVRTPAPTQLERKHEVPTDPERPPVQRRAEVPTTPSSPAVQRPAKGAGDAASPSAQRRVDGAADAASPSTQRRAEPSAGAARPNVSGRGAEPLTEPMRVAVVRELELPTDPERPAVRGPAPVRPVAAAVSAAPVKQAAGSGWWWWVGGLIGVAAASVGAWFRWR